MTPDLKSHILLYIANLDFHDPSVVLLAEPIIEVTFETKMWAH